MKIISIVSESEYNSYKRENKDDRPPMSTQRADEILRLGLKYYEDDIRKHYKGYDDLKPNQKVALLDLAWKYSPTNPKFANVYNKIKSNDVQGAINYIENEYNIKDENNKTIEGLKKRRDYVIETLRG